MLSMNHRSTFGAQKEKQTKKKAQTFINVMQSDSESLF